MQRLPIVVLTAGAVLAGAVGPALAPPPIVPVERVHVELAVRVPAVAPARSVALDVGAGGTARAELTVPWPTGDEVTRVDLTARADERPDRDGRLGVELVATIERPGVATSRAVRRLVFGGRETALFEVARDEAAGPLTLVVEGERRSETVLRTRPPAGRPVRLLLEVQRVAAGRARSLETNALHSLVGEPVSYAFRYGEERGEVALEVRLTPLAIVGEGIELRLALSGTLPAGETTHVVARTEEWLSGRDAASSFTVAAGEPPAGYRFVVTPQF